MSNDAQAGDQVPTYERLAARFAPGEHKTKTIGGTGLTYVDGETVVSRLNEVLGFDGWSFEVTDVTVLEDEVWARGRLTVYSGNRAIVREQAGGQIINRTRGTPARPYVPADGDRPEQPAVPAQKGSIIELNNDIKGAITDCLKKCATLVGVGLYLYDPEARREVADEMRSEKRTGPKAPATTGAAAPGTPASRSATTPPASSARPTSSSTATTSAQVDAAAQLTGAPATPTPIGRLCDECHQMIRDDSVTILKKKDGPKVTVPVAEFEPVCVERLGAFHCAACYDRKYWGAA